MDDFSSALQHVSSVHTAQLQALNEQLKEEQRARRELEERVEALKKANDDARKKVEQAKKKIKQQAKQIRELEKKLQSNDQEELAAASHAEPPTPTAAEGVARLDCPSEDITDTHKLNQTCATLFESPAPAADGSKVNLSDGTPARLVSKSNSREKKDPLQKVSGEEEREREDYHRGESIETVAEDVIILDDDVTGNNDPIPTPSSSSKSAVDPAIDQEITMQNVSTNGEDFLTSLPPSGPVHIVYSHARTYCSHVRPFVEGNELSPKRSHTSQPLSLREAGASKVKWKEVSSSNCASTSATSSTLSDTKPPLSPDRRGSPGNESEGTSATSSPEQSSPSLLCAANSPWKLQQSTSSSSGQQQQSSSTPVNMTHSLFAKTPAAAVVTTPVSMLKSAIPQSDSQFSLDISQSAPLSPELCPLTTPTQKPQLIPPASSAGLKRPSTDAPDPVHSVDRSVVPITPGVTSVNRILNGRKRWMTTHGQSPASENTAATAVASSIGRTSVRSKRGQEQVDFEDEDILPPHSKMHRLTSISDTAVSSHPVDDDHTRLEYEHVMDSSEDEEEDSPMSPVLLYPKHTATVAVTCKSSDNMSVQGEETASKQSSRSSPWKTDQHRILEKAGLPTSYKFEVPIRKKADRDKLEGKACPDCQAWFAKNDGIHGDVQDHLKWTCRHKHLYLPPDEDSRIWNISFPSTEECENIMNRR